MSANDCVALEGAEEELDHQVNESHKSMKRIRETTAFFNKQYQDTPDGPFLRELQTAFVRTILKKFGEIPDHTFYADDCFVTYRNLAFLRDESFIEACHEASLDKVLLGRIWRIYILASTLAKQWHRDGIFIDCGTYNGKAFETALRYAKKISIRRELSSSKIERLIIAADLFDNPPQEARKIDHGETLAETVKARLDEVNNTAVVKGFLPDSLSQVSLENGIVWAQIDLNSEESDLATFRYLERYLKKGAAVIFDDYGFCRYRKTQIALDDYIAKNLKNPIMELPTGQGIYYHCN